MVRHAFVLEALGFGVLHVSQLYVLQPAGRNAGAAQVAAAVLRWTPKRSDSWYMLSPRL